METKVQMSINNVERVYENKFLRMSLDHKICWKPQINKKIKMDKKHCNLRKTKTHTGP